MKTYFYKDGIKKLAQELSGEENIYLGIRPYGFHAGNMLPHVVYPIALGQELKKRGIEPKFNIFIFINDWEQDGLAGPDVKLYPFNIYPKNSTFQFMLDPDNSSKNIVDYWEPIIVRGVSKIKEYFPEVKIRSVRNSEMKNNPVMKKHLLYTIQNPEVIANILRKYTNKPVLDNPLCFAMAVCPNCKKVKGHSRLEGDFVIHTCQNCGEVSKGQYSDFEYWFYHKSLALPRLEAFDIDICITGADHYNEGDYLVRESLIKNYGSKAKFPKTLYTQIVLGRDGDTMGKSRGNAEIIGLEKLFKLFEVNVNNETIQID